MFNTFPRLCQLPHVLPSCAVFGITFIILVWGDCHHAVLLHFYTFFKESITAFAVSVQAHSMARHILSAIFRTEKAVSSGPIFSLP